MPKERVIKALNDIELYLQELVGYKIASINDLRDVKNYRAVSMTLFSLLNRVIDLGQEAIIEKKAGMPSSYKDIFKILYEKKIIDKNELKEFEKLISLRNMLSHEYFRIDEGNIFQAIKKTALIRSFVKKIKEVFKS